jgi:hypothetical protein
MGLPHLTTAKIIIAIFLSAKILSFVVVFDSGLKNILVKIYFFRLVVLMMLF